MKKQRNSIIKNNKGNIKIKINNFQNENNGNNNTLSPMQNIYKDDNNSYLNNISNNNESNVIANILQTNNVKNEIYKNEDFQNSINYRKNSKESLILNNDYSINGDFSFINISENVIPFLYQPHQTKEYSSHAFNNFKFLDIVNSYRMIINIIIDDDSLNSSINLTKIFELIILSLNSLSEIKITHKDFLVCIFFQHFSYEQTFHELFPGLNFYNCSHWNLKNNNFYCSYGYVLSVNDTPINTLLFYKESSTYVEVYKFFYCHVLNDIITLINADSKEIGKTFLLVNWPNGKIFDNSSNKYHKSRILSNIFRICNNRNMILIPDINYYPYDENDIFGYVNQYTLNSDKIEKNLYWDMICGYPIDHRFFFANINFKLYLILKEYYQNEVINIYSNEYYHDYNLSIYLIDKMKNLIIQKIQQVKIQYSDLPSNLIDYFYDYESRRGSEYANFFKLISYFFSWRNMKCFKFLQKIFLFFKLLFFIVQFFWLGLSFLISYAVFNDTFGSRGNKMDYFCSLGYVILIIMLLFISLLYVKNKPKIKNNRINRNKKRNDESNIIIVVLYTIHYIYFIFFIISAIFAIIHIKQGKNIEITDIDYYLFDTNLFIILLIINIILYISPSFIRASNIVSRGFLLYIFIKLPNSTCFFHLPYLFTCIRNINSKKTKMESVYIVLYVLLNGLLTVFCLVFDTKRQRRMDFFFIITIIFTVISGTKLIIVIIGSCCQNHFNKNISTGDIPQYIIANEFNTNIKTVNNSNDIYNNYKNENNININNNLNINENPNLNKNKDDKFKESNFNNNSLKNNKKIIGKTSGTVRSIEKNYSNQFDIHIENNLNSNNNIKNNEPNINNQRNNSYFSNKINLKDYHHIVLEKNNNKNSLTKSVDISYTKTEKEKEKEVLKINNYDNLSKENNSNISPINYPMDSVVNNEEGHNNRESDKIIFFPSDIKIDNYNVDNNQPFDITKTKENNNYNNVNNMLNESDIEEI